MKFGEMIKRVGLMAAVLSLTVAATAALYRAPDPPARYWVYVANESSDLVSLVSFGPEGAALEKDIPVGIMPMDIDGAHGLRVEPGGKHFYVTIAHGTPFGTLWKFRTDDNKLADTVTLGLFPATVGITPDGSLGFVVNFNLHGDPLPSSVSVVFLPMMAEVARIQTCIKPHGSRINHAGTRSYSGCVGDDQLVEISVDKMEVSRRLLLRPGKEQLLTGEPPAPEPGDGRCGPTWTLPSYDDQYVYVACNAHNEILEINAETFEIERRFKAFGKPYNLAGTNDGRLLVSSNKGAQSVSVFDIAKGEEVARIATTQPITHGVVVTPDNRYAFVSNEAIGAVRGTVDVIDLQSFERIASVEVHHQPGGIDFWKMEPLPE
ncbi:MAG: YncE family protein [Gemmatimonadota bacterium]